MCGIFSKRKKGKYMPSRKSKKSFSCGHRGFGQFCKRCALADVMEEHYKNKKEYKTKSGKVWSPAELKEEIARLRKRVY